MLVTENVRQNFRTTDPGDAFNLNCSASGNLTTLPPKHG